MPDYQYFLRLWSLPPAPTLAIEVAAILYLRGWWCLRMAGVPFVPAWRAVAFVSGLLTLWIALASPIDAINSLLLTAHMLQHMLFLMVAPPLILLGAPLVPIARGLPSVARELFGSIAKAPAAEQVGRVLTNPVTGLLLLGIVMFAWHTPILYELAIRSDALHEVEHASFLFASLVFWWPVVSPWPSRAHWPRLAMVPYLLVADLQNTALSAILAFSDRVLYPSYAAVPRFFGLSALDDQVAAGAFMWVAGSVGFIVPAIVIAVQCLSTSSRRDALSAA
jgi:putative membrane protein